jgi:hypothetical protein
LLPFRTGAVWGVGAFEISSEKVGGTKSQPKHRVRCLLCAELNKEYERDYDGTHNLEAHLSSQHKDVPRVKAFISSSTQQKNQSTASKTEKDKVLIEVYPIYSFSRTALT